MVNAGWNLETADLTAGLIENRGRFFSRIRILPLFFSQANQKLLSPPFHVIDRINFSGHRFGTTRLCCTCSAATKSQHTVRWRTVC